MVAAECGAVRKMLRKQASVVDEIREEIFRVPDESEDPSLGPLMELATSFFYLDRSFREQLALSPQRREAFDLFWIRLDRLLSLKGVLMIRQVGEPFDPRLHHVMLPPAVSLEAPIVKEVLQPGFLLDETVKQPAKVTIGQLPKPPSGDDMGVSFI